MLKQLSLTSDVLPGLDASHSFIRMSGAAVGVLSNQLSAPPRRKSVDWALSSKGAKEGGADSAQASLRDATRHRVN